MSDIEILKKVLDQEIKATNRYSAQIAETIDQEIRDAFKKLLEEERSHVGQSVVKIKEVDPSFEFDFKIEESKISDENVDKVDTYESLKGVIELSLEKEKIAAANYEAWAELVQDPEIKSMLIAFKDDEEQHKNLIKNLLLKVEVELGE